MEQNFKQLFGKEELQLILGKSKRNLWRLAFIVFLASIAVAHSVGSYRVLEERMNNPYTKWLKIPIPVHKSLQAKSLVKYISDGDRKLDLGIDSILNYSINNYNTVSRDQKKFELKYRTINSDEELFKNILLEENVFFKNEKFDFENDLCWVILSRQTSTEILNINGHKHAILNPRDNIFLYIPILAVVNELPDNANGLISAHLYAKIQGSWSSSHFVDVQARNYFKVLIPKQNWASVKENYPSYINEIIYTINKQEVAINGEEFFESKVILDESFDEKIIDSISSLFIERCSVCMPITEYECHSSVREKILNPHYLSFMLFDLSRVREIKKLLFQKYNLDISLDQIINKENFRIISFGTLLLVFLIILLLFVSTILFLTSLLNSYLDKISPSLGTLKAFGLSDKILLQSYISVIIKFLSLSFIVGLAMAGAYVFLIGNLNIESMQLDMINKYLFVVLLMLLMIALFTSLKVIRQQLKKSPGDLIYKR